MFGVIFSLNCVLSVLEIPQINPAVHGIFHGVLPCTGHHSSRRRQPAYVRVVLWHNGTSLGHLIYLQFHWAKDCFFSVTLITWFPTLLSRYVISCSCFVLEGGCLCMHSCMNINLFNCINYIAPNLIQYLLSFDASKNQKLKTAQKGLWGVVFFGLFYLKQSCLNLAMHLVLQDRTDVPLFKWHLSSACRSCWGGPTSRMWKGHLWLYPVEVPRTKGSEWITACPGL